MESSSNAVFISAVFLNKMCAAFGETRSRFRAFARA